MLNKSRQLIELHFPKYYYAIAFFLLLFVLAFLFLRDILAMLFFAYILNIGLRPLVNRFEKLGVPRTLGIVVIYVVFFSGVLLFVVLIANQLINQIENLLLALPQVVTTVIDFLQNRFPSLGRVLPLDELKQEAIAFVDDTQGSKLFAELVNKENLFVVVDKAYNLFGGAADLFVRVITVIMVSVYMLQRDAKEYKRFLEYFPTTRREALVRTFTRIEDNLSAWIIGQVSLMLIIGVVTYILLMLPALIFGPENYALDDYALPIAIFAALMEGIPNIGPIVTFVFTTVLAIGTSGLGTVIYVALSFLGLQQVQSNVLQPQVMKKAVGIDPIITILAVIAAFKWYGVMGAVLIVPVIAIAKIVVVEIIREFYPDILKNIESK